MSLYYHQVLPARRAGRKNSYSPSLAAASAQTPARAEARRKSSRLDSSAVVASPEQAFEPELVEAYWAALVAAGKETGDAARRFLHSPYTTGVAG